MTVKEGTALPGINAGKNEVEKEYGLGGSGKSLPGQT